MNKLPAAFLLLTLAGPAFGGGLDPLDGPPDDPCAEPPLTEEVYKAGVFDADPEEWWQMYLSLRAARCGDVEPPPQPWEQWREKGYTDEDLLRFVFNGQKVPLPPPPAIPLPATGWMMLAALGALALARRRA